MIRWFPALVTLAVVGGHVWYYFIYRGFPLTVSFANAVTAFSATITLTLSFALGPVSHVVARLKHVRTYRKDFGLIGYGLASAHVLLAAWAVMERADPIAYSDAASLAFAAVSFGIFSMLALTSNTTWIRRLGFENWKALQRTGYMALVFALIHVALLGQGVFLGRIIGQISVGFILLTLFVRALVLVVQAGRSFAPGPEERADTAP